MYSAYFKHIILACIILLAFVYCEAVAYWPTTVEENFSVSTDPDTFELQCEALAYPDGSTLIVFRQGYVGPVYNIIDKYGEKQFEFPQKLKPDCINNAANEPHLISDGHGGAIIAWNSLSPNPEGVHAQRLDSLGNLIWGNSAVMAYPVSEHDFDICPDGEGGFFLAVAPDEGATDHSDLYMQHVDAGGNLLWGQYGVLIANLPSESERYPKVANCSLGSAYVVWEDHRPPYGIWGGLFAQRISDNGEIMWTNDLDLEAEGVYFHQIIPDGAGGFLLHTNPGGWVQNTVYRVNSNGIILWQQMGVSWYNHAKIVPGESGYFYLGFTYYEGVYGQKMDLDGNTYWPVFGSLEGALMSFIPGIWHNMHEDWFYSAPYFCGVFDYNRAGDYPFTYYAQKLDQNGEPQWGEDGVILTTINEDNYEYQTGIDDGSGGIVLVYELTVSNNVWAKRVMDDGILGGALHLIVDMEPQNPPIQIPPGGGGFQFNVAIEDTYTVESVFDAWIEVTLPNGEDMEILHRDNITIQSNSVITRPDMMQVVPANAPPGSYIYHLYVGSYDYDVIWREDSFEFEKVESMGIDDPWVFDWGLFGWDDEVSLNNNNLPESFDLTAYPNPFNAETTITFNLLNENYVSLTVYDITGREIVKLMEGNYQFGGKRIVWKADNHASGIYFVRLHAGNQTQVMKTILLK